MANTQFKVKAIKTTTIKTTAWFLTEIGLLVILLRRRIVFPGLERILGIKTIGGPRERRLRTTNPGAMVGWVVC